MEREIITASHAGFCFGVEKAVNVVYDQLSRVGESANGKIYTFGPIIHNESVVADLEKRGVEIIPDEETLKHLSGGTVIIRSHGVSKKIYEMIEAQGLTLVDATCPFVKRIHKIVEEASAQGRTILITGNPKHPEVEGIVGWASGEVVVLETLEDVENFRASKNTAYTLVSQTTYNFNKFKKAVEMFSQNGYNIDIMNTICSATEERQKEAEKIASHVDAMIVIGGAHSSNTRKLFEICSRRCDHTYFIQTKRDLDLHRLKSAARIGITAGASTPKKIIEEVQTYVRTGADI